MMREFRRLNPEIPFNEDRDFDIFTGIIYWYLNNPEIETLRAQRGKRFPVKDLQDYQVEYHRSPRRRKHDIRRVLAFDGPGPLPQLLPINLEKKHNDFFGETNDNSDDEDYEADDDSDDEMALDDEAICDPPSDDEPEMETSDLPALKEYFKLPADFVKRSLLEKEPLEVPSQMAPLGEIPHTEILEKILEETASNHSKRYGEFLNSETGARVRAILEDALNDKVKLLFQDAMFCLEDMISIGGDPQDSTEAGVYLHILWNNDRQYWLYIGQAHKFKERIQRP